MSAAEIIAELPKLTESDRQKVLERLLELTGKADHLKEHATQYRAVDLRSRDITEQQAADLRRRLATFADDWNRAEMDVYDED